MMLLLPLLCYLLPFTGVCSCRRDPQQLLVRCAHAAEVHPRMPGCILIMGGYAVNKSALGGPIDPNDAYTMSNELLLLDTDRCAPHHAALAALQQLHGRVRVPLNGETGQAFLVTPWHSAGISSGRSQLQRRATRLVACNLPWALAAQTHGLKTLAEWYIISLLSVSQPMPWPIVLLPEPTGQLQAVYCSAVLPALVHNSICVRAHPVYAASSESMQYRYQHYVCREKQVMHIDGLSHGPCHNVCTPLLTLMVFAVCTCTPRSLPLCLCCVPAVKPSAALLCCCCCCARLTVEHIHTCSGIPPSPRGYHSMSTVGDKAFIVSGPHTVLECV